MIAWSGDLSLKGRNNQYTCSVLVPSKPSAIVWFVSQMAWNVDKLQETFILKCMGNWYHYYWTKLGKCPELLRTSKNTGTWCKTNLCRYIIIEKYSAYHYYFRSRINIDRLRIKLNFYFIKSRIIKCTHLGEACVIFLFEISKNTISESLGWGNGFWWRIQRHECLQCYDVSVELHIPPRDSIVPNSPLRHECLQCYDVSVELHIPPRGSIVPNSPLRFIYCSTIQTTRSMLECAM